MNKFLNFFTTILFISTAILMSCGGSDDPVEETDPLDAQGALIAGTATATEIKQGTQVVEWPGFNVVFTYNPETNTGTYTANNRLADSGDIVWKSSGTWAFNGTDASQIVRDDNVTMTVNATETTMTLSFSVTDPNGRLLTFGGSWTKTFTVTR